MKTKLLVLVVLLTATFTFAQSGKNSFMKIGETEIGGYVGIGARYSTILNSDPAGIFDVKAAVTFDGSWAVGLMGSGFNYHKELTELVSDGKYKFNVSYGALFVEKIFSINDDFKISLAIATGRGEAFYQYDTDYQKDKVWKDEIIDYTVFYVFEPSVEIQHRVFGNWWVGVNGTYRNTSPFRIIGTDENLLRKFSGGITIKWGIF